METILKIIVYLIVFVIFVIPIFVLTLYFIYLTIRMYIAIIRNIFGKPENHVDVCCGSSFMDEYRIRNNLK